MLRSNYPGQGYSRIFNYINKIEEYFSFQSKSWQIFGLFNIKNGRDMMIVEGTSLDKSVLFQNILITVKNGIMLVISLMLALIVNKVYAY